MQPNQGNNGGGGGGSGHGNQPGGRGPMQPPAFMAQQMFMPQMHSQMPMDQNQLAMMNAYYQQ